MGWGRTTTASLRDQATRAPRRQEEARAQAAMCKHLGLELATVNAAMVAHQLNFAGVSQSQRAQLAAWLVGAGALARPSGAAQVSSRSLLPRPRCRPPAPPQTGRRYHDPLPHRNLLLLALAASYAGGRAGGVWLGRGCPCCCRHRSLAWRPAAVLTPVSTHRAALQPTWAPPTSRSA